MKKKTDGLDSCCHGKEHSTGSAEHENKSGNEGTVSKTILFLAAAAFIIMIFNQIQLLSVSSAAGQPVATGVATVSAEVIPKGVPAIYGKELGVSFDDVSVNDAQRADSTIKKLGNLDNTLTLTGSNLERYITIASQISCEYCCGAKSIIFTKEDEERIEKQIQAAIASGKISAAQADQYRQKAGGAACGCAHSFAMRGLGKYLILNHGDEFSDDEILGEMAKWKTLFFPTQMTAKAGVMKEKGMDFSYAKLGSNEFRGLESQATSVNSGNSGGMVGGC